jgi:hypothetical protein
LFRRRHFRSFLGDARSSPRAAPSRRPPSRAPARRCSSRPSPAGGARRRRPGRRLCSRRRRPRRTPAATSLPSTRSAPPRRAGPSLLGFVCFFVVAIELKMGGDERARRTATTATMRTPAREAPTVARPSESNQTFLVSPDTSDRASAREDDNEKAACAPVDIASSSSSRAKAAAAIIGTSADGQALLPVLFLLPSALAAPAARPAAAPLIGRDSERLVVVVGRGVGACCCAIDFRGTGPRGRSCCAG